MMSVEVAGQVVRRPSVADVLVYDRTGRPAVARMRPELLEGERLIERAGQIPAIVKEAPCLM
jgi:hypothetical protein